ncbi:MAG: transcription termination factor Rho [Nocardioidaceae bacterium]
MTQTTDTAASPGSASRGKQDGLNKMLMSDLKNLAGSLGIKGTTGMRKSALVDAIGSAQSGGRPGVSRPAQAAPPAQRSSDAAGQRGPDGSDQRRQGGEQRRTDGADQRPADSGRQDAQPHDKTKPFQNNKDTAGANGQPQDVQSPGGQAQNSRPQGDRDPSQHDDSAQDRSDQAQHAREQHVQGQGHDSSRQSGQSRDSQQVAQSSDRDPQGNSRNSRRRSRSRDRYRDRDKRTTAPGDAEPQVSDDDVLIPAAGILDLLDNYAFVRTTGYLPGPTDVYVSLSMVRKFGLRKGDAITGMVKQSRDTERREKFNPMVRIDTVNGAEPEAAKSRVEFSKLTPLYAADRLRLETEPNQLIGRLIDIVAPVGKGQRGLIVSPSKAGKTIVLQSIANAITTNNPECHLMVVLVDERPEEVTDMQRAVKGEVIASTFDRPAQDHTTVAELAIERAKRLVELGHDVVVLLDSITRLGRAYNLAAPASGRILSGGVDSSALYPPKRFFGAARNIEDGGSLTILATALIETGSKMDEVIFEEFKGTGNMELRLRREYADKRIFPAIDVDASGTRREELLMAKDELQIVWKLRRVLSALEGQQALELLLQKLRHTRSNVEFLMEVNRTTPTASGLRGSDDD